MDLVDSHCGIIRTLEPNFLVPPDPRWWIYTCPLARCPVGTWHSSVSLSASGCSRNPDEALRRALGEAVERYCGLSEVPPDRLRKAKVSHADVIPALPRCATAERCEASLKSWDSDLELDCVEVEHLASGDAALVPAVYAYMAHRPADVSQARALAPPISTGLAFHCGRADALWRGLCEVAERDAMMRMWWTRRPVPQIDLRHGCPEALADRIEQLARVGIAPCLFHITADFGVPTVFCVLRAERHPFFVAGAACHEDPVTVCCKALDEAVGVRASARRSGPCAPPSVTEFEWVTELEHHVQLYANWRRTPAFDFLFDPVRPPLPFEDFQNLPRLPKPDGMDALRRVAAELAAQGLDVFWLDLTSSDTSEFGCTVRVLVPQMIPLSQDHRVRWLASPRLHRANSREAGGLGRFNRFPHPFA